MAGSSNQFLSLLGWTFLPNLVTGWIQTIYYGLAIRAGDPKPAPGTPRHAAHRRRIYVLVVCAYLGYTLYEAAHDLQRAGNYYGDLSLAPGASDREVKARFRRLAALHHPDKVGGGGGGGQDYFMHLKTAADVLTDPARRFAYERFGPEAEAWRPACVTARDFAARGARAVLLPYYGVAAATLWGLGRLGYLEAGRYWRWVCLACLCAFEAAAVTRPRYPALLTAVVNPALARLAGQKPYLPFQLLALARKACVALFIAFAQVGPLLAKQQQHPGEADEAAAAAAGSEEKALRQNLERLEATAKGLDADAARLMELEMAPFAGDPEAIHSMRARLQEWLVQNTIRADPMVRDALGRSFQKRRVDAPAGARGNR
ncbi:hypothetical protein F4780DRAFT_747404 [Xylariomycetidae sp. FL0641]|nr:hypothetical protein F4780DRAFT_747404 [Xylariomycetidae sp. FL0641]